MKEESKIMHTPNVVVVGSGLSAIGAIKALVRNGIKPTVLDVGESLDSERTNTMYQLAKTKPNQWTSEERAFFNANDTLKKGSSIPKKLAFGSDYFYGKSRKNAIVKEEGDIPPFSYGIGGLSAGWGAAVLPPQESDLADWPINIQELNSYSEIILSDLPYSASEDGLSLNFPLLSKKTAPLRLSPSAEVLLNKLNKFVPLRKDDTLYGQARLLVNSTWSEKNEGCQYCGQCMSGCVYKSIYKADDTIMSLYQEGKIDYLKGCLVDKVVDNASGVTVTYFDADDVAVQREFDKVFLAAGAVNSSRIVLNSMNLMNTPVQLKTRGGFVVPVLSLWKLPSSWPDVNTQPGLFLEFKGKYLDHWVHTQVSTDNELLLQKLGINTNETGLAAKIKSFIARHTFLLLVNYHSEHSGIYNLWLEKSSDEEGVTLKTTHKKSFPQLNVLIASGIKLFSILFKVGCLPIFPFAKLNSGSYHVGSTLPMKENPVGLESDTLGRVNNWKNIHVVDTAVFPSLPGTTIGLLTMANAYRIVDKLYNSANREK